MALGVLHNARTQHKCFCVAVEYRLKSIILCGKLKKQYLNSYLSCAFQDGRTALHHAVLENELDVAQHLIDFGADVNIKDEVGIVVS